MHARTLAATASPVVKPALSEAIFEALQGLFQVALPDGEREVAAGALENAARVVSGASQAAGHGVWVIEGDKRAVDVVHHRQHLLAALDVARAQGVEQI